MRFCLDGFGSGCKQHSELHAAKTEGKNSCGSKGHYHGWLDNVAWGISTPSVNALGGRENPEVYPWTQGLPNTAKRRIYVSLRGTILNY